LAVENGIHAMRSDASMVQRNHVADDLRLTPAMPRTGSTEP
jgi:hypothetical protein